LKFGYAKKNLFRTFFYSYIILYYGIRDNALLCSLAQRKEGKRKRAQYLLFGKAMTLAFKTYPFESIPPEAGWHNGSQVLCSKCHHSM
jgi:hypothetical protein